jgi:hypothetical protein
LEDVERDGDGDYWPQAEQTFHVIRIDDLITATRARATGSSRPSTSQTHKAHVYDIYILIGVWSWWSSIAHPAPSCCQFPSGVAGPPAHSPCTPTQRRCTPSIFPPVLFRGGASTLLEGACQVVDDRERAQEKVRTATCAAGFGRSFARFDAGQSFGLGTGD